MFHWSITVTNNSKMFRK